MEDSLELETNELKLTIDERKTFRILLVISDESSRTKISNDLISLGYGDITAAEDYKSAFKKLSDRTFTHAIFETVSEEIDSSDFLSELLRNEPDIVGIPTSLQLDADLLFELLIIGARGYLILPADSESLQSCIELATKGEPIPESILKAEDRNKSLISIMVNQLDELAEAMRQEDLTSSGKVIVQKLMSSFRNSANMAQTFKSGSLDKFLETLEKHCLEMSKSPATRLGRIRKKLKNRRKEEPS